MYSPLEPRRQVPLLSIFACLSQAIDLVSPSVTMHHERVAYFARRIAGKMGLGTVDQDDVLIAALAHDAGALSLRDRLDALEFEFDDRHRHAELGYRLLRAHPALERAALIVKYHHLRWDEKPAGYLSLTGLFPVPVASRVLLLADRIDASLNRGENLMDQVDPLVHKIASLSGTMFMPDAVEAFLDLAKNQWFWIDAGSDFGIRSAIEEARPRSIDLTPLDVASVADMLGTIIDFRSRFTSTHSRGVAKVASAIGDALGLSEDECRMLYVAGALHDLGKLAVPQEILEKPGRLSKREMHVIMSHPVFTHRILRTVDGLWELADWAALHHEKVAGGGYPFGLTGQKLPLGSKIMAIADIFTALTEDRPYRKGMGCSQVVEHMTGLMSSGTLDPKVSKMVLDEFGELDKLRIEAQAAARQEYSAFYTGMSVDPV